MVSQQPGVAGPGTGFDVSAGGLDPNSASGPELAFGAPQASSGLGGRAGHETDSAAVAKGPMSGLL